MRSVRRPPCWGGKVGLSIAALGVTMVAVGCLPPPPPPPPSVIVYGDSLTGDAYNNIAGGLARPGWNIIIREAGGTAPCDWVPQMQRDGNVNAHLVIMQFTGNMMTPCTQGRGGQSSVYFVDESGIASLWASRGVRVLWVSPPGDQGTTGANPVASIDAFVASRSGQPFVDAGAALQAPDGTWPYTLPCFSFEISGGLCRPDGTIPVRRSPTNNHLCPADSGGGACPVYSGGIFRWTGTMLNTARGLF